MKQLFFIVSLLFLTIQSSFSQANFYAKGASQTSTDANYKVIFVLENADGSRFKPPSFEGFTILSGPNQSSSYQWVNGKTSQSISYYYYLRPNQEGTLTIGAANIEVDGKTLSTEPFSVKVIKGQPATTQQQNQQQQRNNTQQAPNEMASGGDWKEQAKENLFVRVYSSKNTPYVGEQIFLYAKLYQRINTYGAQLTEVPEMSGFWKQDIEVNTDDWKVEEYNGKQFNTLVIAKWALFPLREGKFTIDPLKINSVIMINEPRTESFFGFQMQTMGYKQVEYNFSSNAFNINVKPLPVKNKPIDFSGAVGKFNMTTNLDSSKVDVGEPVSLQVKISGKGNIMAFNEPSPVFPSSFEVYDPQVEENISQQSNYINGSKSYEYLIVPNAPGDFNIAPFSFNYFDLETKSYKTLYSDSLDVHVEGEALTQGEIDKSGQIENSDIYHIKTNYDLKKNSTPFYGSVRYYTALATPVFMFVFLLVGMRIIKNRNVDVIAVKRKKAQKEALKRLKQAKIYLDKQNKKAFYNEIFAVLNGYVSDKFTINQADLNKETIIVKFSEKNVSEDLAQQFMEVIQNTERALYSPASETKMQEDYDLCKNCIENIEHELV